MGSIKDFFKVQFGGLIIWWQETIYRVKSWFQFLPSWKRVLIYLFFFALIPGFLITRYGTELYLNYQYARESLASHPSYTDPDKLDQTKVTIIKNSSGTFSAYAIVANNNLDLAVENLSYTFDFYNTANEKVSSSSGKTYILPDQKKWLVIPKVQSLEMIDSAKLTLEPPTWQKRLNLPDIELKLSEPYTYEQVNPLATITEGTVVNNSPYKVKQASLVLVLYDANNSVIAISTREEFDLESFERRAYKVQWPGIYRENVFRIGLESYTNQLDPDNLIIEADAGVDNYIEPN